MYEALVARVRYHIQKANFMGLKDAESTLLLAEAADAIEELQGRAKVLGKLADHWCAAVPKWIPVTERLPDADGFTLIFTAHGNPGVCYFTSGWWGGYGKDGITHWMPLPEPPKEES